MEKRIKFSADKVRVSGPNKDGGYVVAFECGEYTQKQMAELLLIPQMTEIEIEVEVKNG